MEPSVEQILASPRAAHIAEQLQAALQAEAERRTTFREWVTPDMKAEFINGEVVLHSPAWARHNQAAGRLYTLLHLHVELHDLGQIGIEKWMVALSRNDYEPDVCFWRKEVAATFLPDQLLFPVPDFIAEVLSDTTRHRDLDTKLVDYAAHGVGEYWVVDPETQTVSQYLLADEAYHLHLRSDSGVVRSVAVAGFVLPIPALFGAGAFREALPAGRPD
jgi:Uma2 family endonuclease